ncbi:MAG: hypothetical protein K0Q81_921, partial [Paenibacillus sp.]|nr:hypothetical protein [Paenibacillus sp.]
MSGWKRIKSIKEVNSFIRFCRYDKVRIQRTIVYGFLIALVLNNKYKNLIE